MCARRHFALALLWGALAGAPAGAVSTYTVATLPVAAGQGDLEFPLAGHFRAATGLLLVSQGSFTDNNPFAHLWVVSPWGFIHYDGIRNLRLSGGFQELWVPGVSALRLSASHEERFMARARLQEPRGDNALYQMLQFELRSLEDPTGNHQFVFRIRGRVGVGVNLDTNRIHSLTFYQEVALRFADPSYTTHAFDFFQTAIGYTWTTRRGLFVTVGLLGEMSLSPPGGQLTFLYGPVVNLGYRIAVPVAIPPEPPQITPH